MIKFASNLPRGGKESELGFIDQHRVQRRLSSQLASGINFCLVGGASGADEEKYWR